MEINLTEKLNPIKQVNPFTDPLILLNLIVKETVIKL